MQDRHASKSMPQPAPRANPDANLAGGDDLRVAAGLDWLHKARAPIEQSGWILAPETLRPASSDASFRRYFRIDGTHLGKPSHLILMDAPPEREDIRPFIAVDAILQDAGLHVPQIVISDVGLGFLLCSDLGSQTYLQDFKRHNNSFQHADALYQDAWRALIRLQCYGHAVPLPEYNRERLLAEMRLLDEWYLGRHKPVALTDAERNQLFTVYELILRQCLSQPTVIVHRDYHSRNLMVCGEVGQPRNPGVLDFQDAVTGPLTYDLVSLLRDAYIEWDEEQQIDWAVRYWQDAKTAGLPVSMDFSDFWRDFEWMGLQRHLKVLGIFARLYYRDGKENYLNDLPLVLRYAVSVARRYQGLGPLAKLLERTAS